MKSSSKPKLIRTSTIGMSLDIFCNGVLRELSERYDVVAVSSPDEYFENVRRREGVRCVEVPMERQISPLKDIISLWRLYKLFRHEKPLMVHSMTPKAGLLSMIAAWLARVPIRIHTFTGLVFPTAHGLTKRILMATDWLTCACATHIVPEGEGVKRDLLSHHITRKPIKVLGYGNVRGIDLTHYNPDAVEPVFKENTDGVTFISIGRLVGDKGINELVSAFIRLRKDNPNIHLILVGPQEQDLDPLLPETLEAIANTPSIHAVGFQSDIRPWLKSAHVSILASYREGFPNVVIEAGAMGLPQIVTNINGANEIIVEGKNGTIIPPRDADALYHAMRNMLNEEYRTSLAANARDMIASRYEQGFVRRCLYEYYEGVVSKVYNKL
ncbi:MAG: glycosyltransferase family 4 protein [Bacteroidia bacterium]|nr:glycosyltransferase family 4 protein [Bacteroidia bacterium]